ncbi:MAG: hypothetical protein U0Q11_25850 [Vicinamibacterales bacterium]
MHTLIQLHRMIGYPTAFIIAPLALVAYAKGTNHRRLGKAYFYLMLLLYASGTCVTLTNYDWGSWDFARNLSFNFFGFSMLIYAYRAIRLFTTPGDSAPDRIDRGLAWTLTLSVLAIASVAFFKNAAMRVFSLAGIILCALEWRDQQLAVWKKPLLFRRHMRYILASYFYLLTVVSVVHFDDELPGKVKWLWPSVIGFFSIWILTETSASRWLERLHIKTPLAVLTRRAHAPCCLERSRTDVRVRLLRGVRPDVRHRHDRSIASVRRSLNADGPSLCSGQSPRHLR